MLHCRYAFYATVNRCNQTVIFPSLNNDEGHKFFIFDDGPTGHNQIGETKW